MNTISTATPQKKKKKKMPPKEKKGWVDKRKAKDPTDDSKKTSAGDKIVPPWAKTAINKGTSDSKSKELENRAQAKLTKTPKDALQALCRGKQYKFQISPLGAGEGLYKHQVTVSSDNSKADRPRLQMDDEMPGAITKVTKERKFNYIMGNNGNGYSNSDHSLQMSCLYALVRLEYNGFPTLAPRYRSQAELITGRKKQYQGKMVCSKKDQKAIEDHPYSSFIKPELMSSSESINCIKYGDQSFEIQDEGTEDAYDTITYSLGHLKLVCLADEGNYPLFFSNAVASERRSYPPPPSGYRFCGIISNWRDTFGFASITGYGDIFIIPRNLLFAHKGAVLGPGMVLEFTCVDGDSGKMIATDIKILS